MHDAHLAQYTHVTLIAISFIFTNEYTTSKYYAWWCGTTLKAFSPLVQLLFVSLPCLIFRVHSVRAESSTDSLVMASLKPFSEKSPDNASAQLFQLCRRLDTNQKLQETRKSGSVFAIYPRFRSRILWTIELCLEPPFPENRTRFNTRLQLLRLDIFRISFISAV
jgi:hypothetical protein